MTARTSTGIAGAVVVGCVSILLADYAIASWRAPRDDRLIQSLQRQVKSDASMAARLVAGQKRVTDARRARKSRDGAVTWFLIAAAAMFLTSAKRLVGTDLPVVKTMGASRPASVTAIRARAPAAAASLDLTFIDELVAQHGAAKENAIALLQAIQNHYRYLPDEALRHLCELTEITPAQLAGTSSFYGQFRRTPVGRHLVRVCHGTACHVAGARQITDELRRCLAIPEGDDTDASRQFTIGEVACVGCCSLAPVLMVDGHTAGRLTPATAGAALAHVEETEPA